MQVAYGQNLLLSETPEWSGRPFHFGEAQDTCTLNDFPLCNSGSQQSPIANRDVKLSGHDIITTNFKDAAKHHCVNDLQLRSKLLKISAFLERIVPDRVVTHNDSVIDRIERRLQEGAEKFGFIAVNIEQLVDRWGDMRDLLPEINMTIRASLVNTELLAAVVSVLEICVDVSSPNDIALLRKCVEHIASTASCSPHIETTTNHFAHAVGSHIGVIRSVAATKSAFIAGISRLSVGNDAGIRRVCEAVNAIPMHQRKSMQLPSLTLAVRSTQEATSGMDGFSLGSCCVRNSLVAYDVTQICHAMAVASDCELQIGGIQADVSALLNGTVKSVINEMVKNGFVLQKDLRFHIVLEDLASYLKHGADSAALQIHTALGSLENDMISFHISADVSDFLLGSNQILFTRVIGAKPSIGADNSVVGRQVYIDDGIYTSLCQRSGQPSTPAFSVGCKSDTPNCHVVTHNELESMTADEKYNDLPCTIWGQTCDSLDEVMVAPPGLIPAQLNIGDWLSFVVPKGSGNEVNTGFNGYDSPLPRFMIHTGFE